MSAVWSNTTYGSSGSVITQSGGRSQHQLAFDQIQRDQTRPERVGGLR